MSLQSMVKKIADDAKKVVQSATTKTTTNSVTSQSNNENPNTALVSKQLMQEVITGLNM